jgi:hypothetical protein
MIQEIENFRKKYPEYSDIDDITLANKLASKYPDSYSDLPQKVSQTKVSQTDVSILQPQLKQDVMPWKRTVSNIQRPLLEAIGLVGGAAGGTALGSMAGGMGAIPGSVTGGALGYAGGASLADIIDTNLLGINRNQPLPETLARTAKDIGKGATFEMAGQGAGKVLPGIINKAIGSKQTPEMIARQALFNKYGIPASPADVTQKKSTALLEGFLKKGLSSAGKMQAAEEAKQTALQKVAKGVQEGVGGPMDMLSAGQLAQEMGKSRYAQFMSQASKIYKSIPVKPDTLVETNTLRDVAIGHLDDLGKMESSAIKKILSIARESSDTQMVFDPKQIVSATGQPFKGAKLPSYTWNELLADQSTLRKAATSTSDFNKKRIFNNLVNAINDDIAVFSKNIGDPQTKQMLDYAVKFYKEGDATIPGVKTFRDRQIMNVLNTGSPEDIVRQFIKPNNISDVHRLSKTIGSEGMQPIKQAWLEKMFRLGEEQSLDLVKYANAFNKYDDATLRAFLSPQELSGLKELAHMTKQLQNVERMGGNPSGTAQQMGVQIDLYMLLKAPVLWSMKLIGSNRLAGLYLNNPRFRQILIQGLKGQKIASATKLLAIAGVENERHDQSMVGE